MSTTPLFNPAVTPVTPRPSIVQLVFKEKSELYAAYIPLFKDGGIFITTYRDHKLGDDVYILLTLPGELQRYPVTGKVAWITPVQAAGGQAQGVGVRFTADEKSGSLKARIEEILATHLGSNKSTHTM